METKFTILSHACLLLERGDTKVLIDPWLIGSCYWGSWWNYPEPDIDPEIIKNVDYVIISHVHWDHWHGLTLKKYFKGCHYIVPDEYQQRSYKDLKQLKLGDITVSKHGKTLNLPNDISITCYSFGLFLNDSAIAIETPDCKLLNVNDCKIAGLPLKHIMKKHGHFDFAFRSHSSANYRACINSKEPIRPDDPLHYARDFEIFMRHLKPTYAIPFASNHCHLHKDTYHFNSLITNPIRLTTQLGENACGQTELVIMIPGSSWSSSSGFHLATLECFEDIDQKIKDYANKKTQALQKLYDKEAKATITQKVINKHCTHLKNLPKFLRKRLDATPLAYCIHSINDNKSYYKINYKKGTMKPCTLEDYTKTPLRISWPTKVFFDAVYKNMYAHAFISKRVTFYIDTNTYLKAMTLRASLLDLTELNVFPLRFSYFYKLFKNYCSRYRELIVYFQAAYYIKIKKVPMYLLNEYITPKEK